MEYEKAYITFRCKYLMKLPMKVSKTMSFGRFFFPEGAGAGQNGKGDVKISVGNFVTSGLREIFPQPGST